MFFLAIEPALAEAVLAARAMICPIELANAPDEQCLVDEADLQWACQFIWRKNGHGYAQRHTTHNGYYKLLHRELLHLNSGDLVHIHHRNGNKLDNRRANLEILTRAEHTQKHHSHEHMQYLLRQERLRRAFEYIQAQPETII